MKSKLKKYIAALLAIVMLIGVIPLSVLADSSKQYSDYLDGWTVNILWSTMQKDYEWNATLNENRQPRIFVTLYNANVGADEGTHSPDEIAYEAGSMKFTIPGVGGAVRGKTVIANDIAAGSDSAGNRWDYTWDQATDTYTFTNNFPIYYQQSVNAGFEFLWTFNARENTDGFERVIEPTFSVAGKGEINIEPLTYKFTSEPDYYRIYIPDPPTPLGHDTAESLDSNFAWYNVHTRIDMDTLARALYSSSYFFSFEKLPAGIDKNGIKAFDGAGNELEIIEKDGKLGFYLFKERMGEIKEVNNNKANHFYFNVGFKRDALVGSDNTVAMHGHLDRQYYDHDDWWTTKTRENDIVDVDIEFTAADYSFNYNGLIYHMCKKGPYSYNNQGKSAPSKYSSRYNVRNLYRGGVVEFTLHGQANRDYGTSYQTAGISTNNVVTYDTNDNDYYSKIKEDQEWSMILGDDTLIILREDTSVRRLEDDEYDFAYVTIPRKLKNTDEGYDFDVYVAKTQDAKYEEYTKYEPGSGNTKELTNVKLPEGTKAFYVRINGIVGSFDYRIYPAVRMHLNYAKDQASGNPINPEAYFANFGYIRAMYWDDEKNAECDDIRIRRESYGGSYADQLASQDQERYGQYLWHDYANVYLRNPIINLETEIELGEFTRTTDRTRFDTTINAIGTIKGDEEGPLEKFSMYIVLPPGVHVDVDKLFSVSGSGITVDGARISGVDFAGHAKIRVEERNGTEMVFIDFDFSDMPIEIKNGAQISANFSGYLSYTDYQIYGSQYTAYSYVGVHDEGADKITGKHIVADQYDFDDDGSQTDLLARDESIRDIEYAAQQWSERVSKYVASAYSDGYVMETVVKRYANGVEDKDQPGSFYSYRLDFEIGANMATDIWFYDALEQGADISVAGDTGDTIKHIDSAWQGTFLSVDASFVESLGAVATVYYSTNPNQEFSSKASGWNKLTESTDRSTVRAIAVELDTSGMPMGGFMAPDTNYAYIIVNMKAPDSQEYDNTKAVNQYTVHYTGRAENDTQERTSLPSNETYITLQETIGGFTIRKVDKANGAALTGAEFAVYDQETGGNLIKEGAVNSLGQFIVNNLPYGKYYWEETKAPEGYKKIEGRHEVIVGSETVVFVDAENERIPGSVVLTKTDGTNNAYGNLSGAEFALYRSGGDMLFADGSNGKYTYNTDGKVSTFVTDSEGKITVSGLPWGSYYFIETKAPNGYELNERTVAFTIGKSQYDSETGTIVAEVTAENTEILSHISLVKTDSKSGAAIQGAVFSLYRVVEDGEDYLVASGLQTDFKGRIDYEGDLPFGTYYFVETRNAAGYKMPANTKTDTITIDANNAGGTIQIKFKNDPLSGSVELMKTDEFRKTVDGAEYELYLKGSGSGKDKLIGMYMTEEGGFIRVSDLEWGDYYFVEVSAPRGYEVSDEHIEFSVNKTTVQNTIYVYAQDYRQSGSIKLIKTDKEDKELFLEGAEYELYSTVGVLQVAGKDYTTDREDNKIITGADGSVTISGIKQGGYYLKEIVAPAGYTVSAEFIRFSIGTETAGVVQTIRAEDEKGKAIIVVNKSINAVYEAFGNPTFIFTVTNDDTGQVYTKSITLSELQLTGSINFEVDADHTYTVREYISTRYGLVEITNVENIVATDLEKGTAKADLTDGKTRAEVTYRNEIEQYEKLSQSTNVTNIVKSRAKLTAIMVDYIGPNPINNENVSGLNGYDPSTKVYTFQADDLIVKAQYDDGSSKDLTLGEALASGVYTLSQYSIDRNEADPTVTITVTYEENGITVTGAFTVIIESPVNDLYTVTLKLNGCSVVPGDDWGGDSAVTADLVKANIADGTKITLPASKPTKDGYVFTEWLDDRGNSYQPGAKITVKEDMTLTAQYVIVYTVTLDPGAGDWGDNAPDDTWTHLGSGRYQKALDPTSGAAVKLPDKDPQRAGEYYFYGWEDLNDKSADKTYYNGSYTPRNGSTEANITLTAHYADYTVKYAVNIYGINHDQDEEGNTLGLTFGPAIGADYRASYIAHTDAYDPAEPCIHWMTWEQIIDQSQMDPTVFQTCLDNGCTTSVKLIINDTLKRDNFYGTMSGDGAALLYYSILGDYRAWNSVNDNTGGWGDSKIRNTMNGTPTANSSEFTEENALISTFPKVLQNGIVAKDVKYIADRTIKPNIISHSFDKLWFLAAAEYYTDTSPREEGPAYERQRNLYEANNNKLYNDVFQLINETGVKNYVWLRTITSNSDHTNTNLIWFQSEGNVNVHGNITSKATNCAVAPCFCIR